jgi:hypothetical protein
MSEVMDSNRSPETSKPQKFFVVFSVTSHKFFNSILKLATTASFYTTFNLSLTILRRCCTVENS